MSGSDSMRSAQQQILPIQLDPNISKHYSIYPLHHLSSGRIFSGYESFASYISKNKSARIDGFSGVNWRDVYESLTQQFEKMGLKVNWYFTDDFLREENEIEILRSPFIGEEGYVWGKRATLKLEDFFHLEPLSQLIYKDEADLNIVIGHGASFVDWQGPLIYMEVPKNEIQYRMRAGGVKNLGMRKVSSYEEQYKSLYFLDWVVLRQHRESIFHKINVLADTQWHDNLSWMGTTELIDAINEISSKPFRVRPWFEKGVWGGQFLKNFVPGISQEEDNYAWSFELIIPENGIILHSEGTNLEIPFDLLMFLNNREVLGVHTEIFGTDFPIRFDFLDTVKGGNLSLQVHPALKYIRENFGEVITQDETYYILDCEEDSTVYLGFREDIDPEQFKKAAYESYQHSRVIQVEDYVQKFNSRKHDLYLIPNGTIHSAGSGNLVLEISATPYIFTFKIYDWLRPDLNGKPRPISLEPAFENVDYVFKGDKVSKDLISEPTLQSSGINWSIFNYPTHEKHFYDINQIRLQGSLKLNTEGVCKVMMVVEGDGIIIIGPTGIRTTYFYAETFVIPAAMGDYTLRSLTDEPVKIIEAFLKSSHPIFAELLTLKK